MSMRSGARFGTLETWYETIPAATPMVQPIADAEMYHGKSFASIQKKINEENRRAAQMPPGERIYRSSNGSWYRFEAGKPVQLTEEQLLQEGVNLRCW